MAKLLDTGTATAADNMQIDRLLLQKLSSEREAILHLYDWSEECATYGHFIDPEKHLDCQFIAGLPFSIARRPTGGGIVFHHCDFAFSFLLPAHHPKFSLNTLENYALVNEIVSGVIRTFLQDRGSPSLLPEEKESFDDGCRHFCMAKPTIYDVMLDGRKVGGAAQRRTKEGFLHQGTISLSIPAEDFLSRILKHNQSVIHAMQHHTYPLLGVGKVDPFALQQARRRLRELLTNAICSSDL